MELEIKYKKYRYNPLCICDDNPYNVLTQSFVFVRDDLDHFYYKETPNSYIKIYGIEDGSYISEHNQLIDFDLDSWEFIKDIETAEELFQELL